MSRKKTAIILIVGFLIGIFVLLYHALSDYWNSKTQTRAIVDYESVLKGMSTEEYAAMIEAAHRYNKELYETGDALLRYESVAGYNETLCFDRASSMMGYLKIERIGVELPVYHGTSESVLAIGVGHLEGSSLPVGGESTHSVLSAHRGLPSAKLFTDLDRMEMGDTFQITVLDQVLTYQVDLIQTIEPTEIEQLKIVEGKDYCTLFTCTPYGINTHRLLVRGVRIETIEEKPVIYVSNDAFRIEPLLVTPAVAAPMLFGFLIHLLVKYQEPPKKKEDGKGGAENETKVDHA